MERGNVWNSHQQDKKKKQNGLWNRSDISKNFPFLSGQSSGHKKKKHADDNGLSIAATP
jgi:hypothetical protein